MGVIEVDRMNGFVSCEMSDCDGRWELRKRGRTRRALCAKLMKESKSDWTTKMSFSLIFDWARERRDVEEMWKWKVRTELSCACREVCACNCRDGRWADCEERRNGVPKGSANSCFKSWRPHEAKM